MAVVTCRNREAEFCRGNRMAVTAHSGRATFVA